MAKYKRRPKVKRYRRSFYSRGMRIRKIVGIVVLVAVVLAAAWFAAPHVLDWATHTWYTVVKDRDLGRVELELRFVLLPEVLAGLLGGGVFRLGSVRSGCCFLGGIGAGRGRL